MMTWYKKKGVVACCNSRRAASNSVKTSNSLLTQTIFKPLRCHKKAHWTMIIKCNYSNKRVTCPLRKTTMSNSSTKAKRTVESSATKGSIEESKVMNKISLRMCHRFLMRRWLIARDARLITGSPTKLNTEQWSLNLRSEICSLVPEGVHIRIKDRRKRTPIRRNPMSRSRFQPITYLTIRIKLRIKWWPRIQIANSFRKLPKLSLTRICAEFKLLEDPKP